MTDRSADKVKARSRSDSATTDKSLARWHFLRLTLLVISAVLVGNPLLPVLANENASGSLYNRDDARFQRLASACLDCHVIDASESHVGPTLRGILGRRAASIKEYDYSAALYEKAAIGLIWNEFTLDHFLKSPQTMVPGIAMIYYGIPDADDRAQLIAWLASGPEPLVTPAPEATALQNDPQVRAVLQSQVDIEYGEYLAGQCLTCHSSPGSADSVPPIKGLPAAYFVKALLDYKQGERSNSVMQTMSEALGVEELAALASFFAKSAH